MRNSTLQQQIKSDQRHTPFYLRKGAYKFAFATKHSRTSTSPMICGTIRTFVIDVTSDQRSGGAAIRYLEASIRKIFHCCSVVDWRTGDINQMKRKKNLHKKSE